MPGYIPPTGAENRLYAAVMRAAAYEFEADQIDPDRRCKLDEAVANYARVLVFEINQRPSDLQPAGWALTICDDPYTEIAGWKAKTDRMGEKVQFLAGFNRELTDEIEQLRESAKAHRAYVKDAEKRRQVQRQTEADLRQANEELEGLRAELHKAQDKVRAAGQCKPWIDDLGRKFVFCDELYHALEPELWPEPKPVRLDRGEEPET